MTMEQQFPTSPTAPTTSKSNPSVIHGNHSNPEISGEGAVSFVGGEELIICLCFHLFNVTSHTPITKKHIMNIGYKTTGYNTPTLGMCKQHWDFKCIICLSICYSYLCLFVTSLVPSQNYWLLDEQCALSVKGSQATGKLLGQALPLSLSLSLSLSLFPRGALSRNVRAVSPQGVKIGSAQSASASAASKSFHGNIIINIDWTW